MTEDREGVLRELRPLFAEYEEADMARRVGKGDKHANLSRLIDADRAVRAALAAEPRSRVKGLDLQTLLHRHGIGCRGRDTESAAWHVAAAAALVADGVER